MGRAVKRLTMEGGIPYLPDDIIVNILKRLSVRSLIRFQCVCKHWKDLIKTPAFIAYHLQHSSHQNPSLLLRWDSFRSSAFKFNWVLLDSDMRELVVQSSPLIDSLSYPHIYGSSNGLLCIKGGSTSYQKKKNKGGSTDSILLWNPATREIRQVPRPINDWKGMYYIGFGFSPIINDYKIVIIYEQSRDDVTQVNRVDVYSLSTKSWKEVEFENLEGLRLSLDTVSADGDVFWFGYKGDDDYCSVVSFDIANEVFSLLPMPELDDDSSEPKLTVFENNLAMLCCKSITEYEYCVELWVMEDASRSSGERWTLTNKYTSSLCRGPNMFYPNTTWSNEIVFEPRFKFESEGKYDGTKIALYLFNLATNEFNTSVIHTYGYGLQILNYVESLVSIGDIHVENP